MAWCNVCRDTSDMCTCDPPFSIEKVQRSMASLRGHIPEIIKGMNFIAIHKALDAMEWRWFTEMTHHYAGGSSHVPLAEELKEKAEELLHTALRDYEGQQKQELDRRLSYHLQAGGFDVEVTLHHLVLRFVLGSSRWDD